MQRLNSGINITKKDGIVTLTPKGEKHKNTLIFLHGWGQSGSQWQDYFASGGVVPHDFKVILPTAPKSFTTLYGVEGNAWADIYTFNASQEDVNKLINLKSAQENTEKLNLLIDQEIDELGGDSTRCFIGGFSMGATQASYVWKQYKKPLGGLIIYSSHAIKNLEIAKEQEYSPVLWTHGLDDCVMLYKHGVFHNLNLENGKRKFSQITRDGLGHAVDSVIKIETLRFLDKISTKPKL